MAKVKAKQEELPGVPRPAKHADIEAAADEFIEAVDKAKRVSEDKKAAQEKLVMAMQRHAVRTYKFDGHLLTLEELERVKVSASDEGDGDE